MLISIFKKKLNILIILGFFCVLYNPPVLSFNTMHIVGLISIIYLAVNRYIRISGAIIQWIKYFVIILVYLLFLVVILHGNSVSDVVYPVYYLIDIIPFAGAINIYKTKNALQMEDILKMIFIAALLQAILAFVAFTNPLFQAAIIKRIISFGGIESYNYWSTLRMYGFSNGLLFEMPVIQTVLAILAMYFTSYKGKSYIALAVVLFFSAIINARSSIIIAFVGLVVIVIFSRQSIKKKIETILGAVIVLILIILVLLPYIQNNAPSTYKWIKEGMEDIIGLINRESSTGYFSYLSNVEKYRLPESMWGLVFGEGISVAGGKNSYNVSSDIGFINDIWVGGIVYLAIEYFMFARRMYELIKSKDEFTSLMGVLFILLIGVLNFKGWIFTMNSLMNLIVIMYILLRSSKEPIITDDKSSIDSIPIEM